MSVQILPNVNISDIESPADALSGVIKPIPAKDVTGYGEGKTHRYDPAMEHLDGVERHDFVYTGGKKVPSVIFCWKRK